MRYVVSWHDATGEHRAECDTWTDALGRVLALRRDPTTRETVQSWREDTRPTESGVKL